jgi:tRNA(Ile)-lysidine synthase TilS/MesJ
LCLCREQDLRIIRPFVYVREKDLRAFAEFQGLPVIPENCPGCFDAPKVRRENGISFDLSNQHNEQIFISKIMNNKHERL